MRLHPSTCLILAGSWIASCSLINAPDDVVPQGTAGSSPGGGSGGSDVGSAGDGGDVGTSGGTGNEGGSLALGGGGGAGDDGGAAGNAGSGGEAGSGPETSDGLVVIGGLVGPTTRVLSVLSARTGAEIVREPLPVAAVAYDEAKDVWFVFKASQFPASATGTADLEVRRFDSAAGTWSRLGTVPGLPPPQPDQLVALNNRLAYLSYRLVNGAAQTALTVLDTTTLASVTELMSRPATGTESYVGIVGDRGSDVDPAATGGRLRLMVASECTAAAGDCKLSALQVFVTGSVTDGTSASLDRFVGKPRFVKARREDKLYTALRSTSPNRVVIKAYGPTFAAPTIFTLAAFVGDDVGGFDLVECANAGVITGVDGAQMIAFHLESGNQRVQALGHPGAPVYTEPFD
ncbi:MAG TPA: hypothetical protein VIW29_07965, partial [Polyangiaceae bacterium]